MQLTRTTLPLFTRAYLPAPVTGYRPPLSGPFFSPPSNPVQRLLVSGRTFLPRPLGTGPISNSLLTHPSRGRPKLSPLLASAPMIPFTSWFQGARLVISPSHTTPSAKHPLAVSSPTTRALDVPIKTFALPQFQKNARVAPEASVVAADTAHPIMTTQSLPGSPVDLTQTTSPTVIFNVPTTPVTAPLGIAEKPVASFNATAQFFSGTTFPTENDFAGLPLFTPLDETASITEQSPLSDSNLSAAESPQSSTPRAPQDSTSIISVSPAASGSFPIASLAPVDQTIFSQAPTSPTGEEIPFEKHNPGPRPKILTTHVPSSLNPLTVDLRAAPRPLHDTHQSDDELPTNLYRVSAATGLSADSDASQEDGGQGDNPPSQ